MCTADARRRLWPYGACDRGGLLPVPWQRAAARKVSGAALQLLLACDMRILITGASGMLGLDVLQAAIDAGDEVAGLTHADLDIADAQACERAIASANADAVINCAAYTNVDGAQSDPGTAHAVNGAGAGNVARAAARAGAWMLHVSSDYVFDGAKRAPYLESDPTGPLSVYGASKLAGARSRGRRPRGAHDRSLLVAVRRLRAVLPGDDPAPRERAR